jgi:hypothetical protein
LRHTATRLPLKVMLARVAAQLPGTGLLIESVCHD